MRKSSRMGRAPACSASVAVSLSLRSRYFSDFFWKNETHRRAGRRWSEVRGRKGNEAGASKISALPNWSLVTRERDGTIVGRLCQTPFPGWRFTETPYKCKESLGRQTRLQMNRAF